MSSPRRSRRPSAAKSLPEMSETPVPVPPPGEDSASGQRDVVVENVEDIPEVEDDEPIASIANLISL